MANRVEPQEPQEPQDLFKVAPEYDVQLVERTIIEVMAERALYPFRPTQIMLTPNGYHAW